MKTDQLNALSHRVLDFHDQVAYWLHRNNIGPNIEGFDARSGMSITREWVERSMHSPIYGNCYSL